ncbi:MAG: coenzyme F420-0:L-glutamate ligase [Candidatus Lokiarchaeota archaeon]|nr:coenzyme F420-0:L-glutamate ligase [Candidatus Lokiarchaeota archaeon]
MLVIPLKDFPQIKILDDLELIIANYFEEESLEINDGDILVVAHTIVSIAEGSVVNKTDVTISERAMKIAKKNNVDPIKVELALRDGEIIRDTPVLITQNEHGLITDYSGVDESNAPPECFVLLPTNPDRSARKLHEYFLEKFGIHVPVIISDTQGRPWRKGSINLAIGIAGMSPFMKYAGSTDLYGNELHSSVVCIADELASAAELVMGQADEGVPLVLIRGVEYIKSDEDASEIIRNKSENLFQ